MSIRCGIDPRYLLRLGVGTACILASPVAARTWHISVDATGDAPTIQAGVDSSTTGDTVLVGPGRYYEDVDFLGKGIVLKSEMGAEATILDGSQEDSSIVMFHTGEPRNAVLEGFTLTGGRGTGPNGLREGGAIWCVTGSPSVRDNVISASTAYIGGGAVIGPGSSERRPWPGPVFDSNVFENNTAELNGGAIRVRISYAIIRGNVFRENRTQRGDGGAVAVRLAPGSCDIVGNTFSGNVAEDQGGAILATADLGGGPINIERNVFVRNRSKGSGVSNNGTGGAIAFIGVYGSIRENTFAYNVEDAANSYDGGAIRLLRSEIGTYIEDNIIAFSDDCGIACWEGAQATFGVNLFWGNRTADVEGASGSCPPGWQELGVFADPLFCNPSGDDFSVSANSPALQQAQPLGAHDAPGCQGTAVHRTTWGRIKTLYH